jgi:hypothetical protein
MAGRATRRRFLGTTVAGGMLAGEEKHCHGRICVCDIARTLSATI